MALQKWLKLIALQTLIWTNCSQRIPGTPDLVAITNLLTLPYRPFIETPPTIPVPNPKRKLFGLPPLPDDNLIVAQFTLTVPTTTTTRTTTSFKLFTFPPLTLPTLPTSPTYDYYGINTIPELPPQHESKYAGLFAPDGSLIKKPSKNNSLTLNNLSEMSNDGHRHLRLATVLRAYDSTGTSGDKQDEIEFDEQGVNKREANFLRHGTEKMKIDKRDTVPQQRDTVLSSAVKHSFSNLVSEVVSPKRRSESRRADLPEVGRVKSSTLVRLPFIDSDSRLSENKLIGPSVHKLRSVSQTLNPNGVDRKSSPSNGTTKPQSYLFTQKPVEKSVNKKGSRRSRIVAEILRRLAMGRNGKPHLFDLPTVLLVPEKHYKSNLAPISKSATITTTMVATSKKQNPSTLTPFTQAPVWTQAFPQVQANWVTPRPLFVSPLHAPQVVPKILSQIPQRSQNFTYQQDVAYRDPQDAAYLREVEEYDHRQEYERLRTAPVVRIPAWITQQTQRNPVNAAYQREVENYNRQQRSRVAASPNQFAGQSKNLQEIAAMQNAIQPQVQLRSATLAATSQLNQPSGSQPYYNYYLIAQAPQIIQHSNSATGQRQVTETSALAVHPATAFQNLVGNSPSQINFAASGVPLYNPSIPTLLTVYPKGAVIRRLPSAKTNAHEINK